MQFICHGGNNELEFLAMSALPEINQFRRRGLPATDSYTLIGVS